MKFLQKTGFVVLCVILGAILNGFVFMIFWKWFIASTLNVPPISLPQAIGLALLFRYLMPNSKSESSGKSLDDITEEGIGTSLAIMFFVGLATIGMGWLIFQFI